ncbi:hypothetical protein QCA50_003034 [Cerrena zonata]|uniref:Uncharacterized protein n=1 Tax=Cerrena zonata TaxID=2478898 RepID=A0AAW0GVB4_9APHY
MSCNNRDYDVEGRPVLVYETSCLLHYKIGFTSKHRHRHGHSFFDSFVRTLVSPTRTYLRLSPSMSQISSRPYCITSREMVSAARAVNQHFMWLFSACIATLTVV